jgi:hypothetical protein
MKKFGHVIRDKHPGSATQLFSVRERLKSIVKQSKTGPEGALLKEFAAAVSWNSAFYLWKNAA